MSDFGLVPHDLQLKHALCKRHTSLHRPSGTIAHFTRNCRPGTVLKVQARAFHPGLFRRPGADSGFASPTRLWMRSPRTVSIDSRLTPMDAKLGGSYSTSAIC